MTFSYFLTHVFLNPRLNAEVLCIEAIIFLKFRGGVDPWF